MGISEDHTTNNNPVAKASAKYTNKKLSAIPPRIIVPPRFVSLKPGKNEFRPIVAAMARKIIPGIKAHQFSRLVTYRDRNNTPAIPEANVQNNAPPLKIPMVSRSNSTPPITTTESTISQI